MHFRENVHSRAWIIHCVNPMHFFRLTKVVYTTVFEQAPRESRYMQIFRTCCQSFIVTFLNDMPKLTMNGHCLGFAPPIQKSAFFLIKTDLITQVSDLL